MGEQHAAHEAPGAREDAGDERVLEGERRGGRGAACDGDVWATRARDEGGGEVGGTGWVLMVGGDGGRWEEGHTRCR